MLSKGRVALCTASVVEHITFLPIGNYNQVFLNTTIQFDNPFMFFSALLYLMLYIALLFCPAILFLPYKG
jgi:hypothetical protein